MPTTYTPELHGHAPPTTTHDIHAQPEVPQLVGHGDVKLTAQAESEFGTQGDVATPHTG